MIFFYDVELFLLAKKLFLSVTEVPVKYIHNNKSSISLLSDSVKMFFKIITIKKTIIKVINSITHLLYCIKIIYYLNI